VDPGPVLAIPGRLPVAWPILAGMWPVHLLRAAHPSVALGTSLALALAALLSGRPAREAALVLATVLVGQAVQGWHRDLVDRERDAAAQRSDRPLASGRIDPGCVWFAVACAVLLLVPLALGNGVTAGSAYLVSVGVGLLGNVALRRSAYSWLPWAVAYALLPAFLSYGGWGGRTDGDPPTYVMTALAALLGVTVHFLLALPHLVDDQAAGLRHLPLRVALRVGARRLLWISAATAALLVGLLLVAGATVGLRQ
jgi:4-hydroxybenzoate polyprenyltransferase